jgi:hypothetical protein
MRRRLFCIALFLVTFGVACQRTEQPAATSAAPAPTATQPTPDTAMTASGLPDDLSPLTGQKWIDDVTIEIGGNVDANGALVPGTPTREFKVGNAVIVSMGVGSVPPKTAIKVVWIGPNASKIGEESKATAAGQKNLTFTAPDTKSWAKGDYRAEVWFGEHKVAQESFKIV